MSQNNLLKLLIVDDEYLVRNLLRHCLDWNEIGYEVVGEASNAHEALELVESLRPDVIFTDIYMPFMDGLEFGKIVFEKYPHIKIVVLTGHEEFEYAKKSVKIGISDFLLKPINDDEIRKTALNLKSKIEKERNQQEEYNKLQKQLEEALPCLKEQFLNQLLLSNIDKEEARVQAEYYKINLNSNYYIVSVIEASPADEERSSVNEEGRLLLNLKAHNLVTRYFRDDPDVYVFRDAFQNIVILNCEKDLDFSDCLEALRSLIINSLKCNVSIGQGKAYPIIGKISKSYKEALYALRYKIIAGKNQVISYDEINLSASKQVQFQNDNFDTLAFYLKAGLYNKVEEYIVSTFNEYTGQETLNIQTYRAIASYIVSVILNVILEIDINISDIFSNTGQPFEQIFKSDTLPEIRDYLVSIAKKTVDTIQNTQTKKVSQIIEQIKEYIKQNQSDPDITLSSTAKKFYMNMSYLSRIFKQETGYTFVEYLTKTRMEKAVKLLKETDLRAYQVAEKVGIQNPHYFGICFKKWTGMSINDFRKSLNKK
ncbi:MAG: response regulator [Clostridiaceae bacterium]|nr:response regulator [Clostridiaceae bacterium]